MSSKSSYRRAIVAPWTESLGSKPVNRHQRRAAKKMGLLVGERELETVAVPVEAEPLITAPRAPADKIVTWPGEPMSEPLPFTHQESDS